MKLVPTLLALVSSTAYAAASDLRLKELATVLTPQDAVYESGEGLVRVPVDMQNVAVTFEGGAGVGAGVVSVVDLSREDCGFDDPSATFRVAVFPRKCLRSPAELREAALAPTGPRLKNVYRKTTDDGATHDILLFWRFSVIVETGAAMEPVVQELQQAGFTVPGPEMFLPSVILGVGMSETPHATIFDAASDVAQLGGVKLVEIETAPVIDPAAPSAGIRN